MKRRGIYDVYNDFIVENSSLGVRPLCRAIAKEFNLTEEDYSESGLNKHIRKVFREADMESAEVTEEKSILEKLAEKHGIKASEVKSGWVADTIEGVKISARVAANSSVKSEGLTDTTISGVVDRVLSNYEPIKVPNKDSRGSNALKVILSDIHVGLEPNPEGNGLFTYEYNAEIFNKNLDNVFNNVMSEYNSHGTFEMFVLDDLGDGLDGWDGFTTRGGHKLDQNMGNLEAFETYVDGKYSLMRRIIEAGVAKKYMVRSVTNCNHSGDFGAIANKTVEKMLTIGTNQKVEFVLLERFMEHFTWGDHCFIITHGKDKKHMNRGLPVVLNDRSINFINDYIEHYEIDSKYIHLEKGDLHQVGYQRAKKFDYRNYMSFSAPSNWQQHNFGDSYSGYSMQIVPKYGANIKHMDIYFDMKKQFSK